MFTYSVFLVLVSIFNLILLWNVLVARGKDDKVGMEEPPWPDDINEALRNCTHDAMLNKARECGEKYVVDDTYYIWHMAKYRGKVFILSVERKDV